MQISRAMSKTISRALIGVLLFAQFAVASYACPGLMGSAAKADGKAGVAITATASVQVSAAATPASMPPACDQMDPAAANLCAEHCRFGQQSADTAPAPIVHVAIPTLLYPLPLEPQRLLGSGRAFPAADASLVAALSPPHTILHCVFRI